MRGITKDSGITQASNNTAAPITHKLQEKDEDFQGEPAPTHRKSSQGRIYPDFSPQGPSRLPISISNQKAENVKGPFLLSRKVPYDGEQ